MRKIPASPSAPMKRLSRTLTAKASATNIYNDLPSTPTTLSEASILEECRKPGNEPSSPIWASEIGTKRPADHTELDIFREAAERNPRSSDDVLSAFSSVGDFLPDETADINLIKAAGTDNDFVAIKRIAHVLAKRRNMDVNSIMPKLLDLFATHSWEDGSTVSKLPRGLRGNTFIDRRAKRSNSVESLPSGIGTQLPRSHSMAANHPLTEMHARKHLTLKTKASGLLSRLRPQLNVDTSSAGGRRFSFEPGTMQMLL